MVAAGHMFICTHQIHKESGSKVKIVLSRRGRNCHFKIALLFLSRLQVALLSTGYITLKLKLEICLEVLYLRIDLVALLPTGYGKSSYFSSKSFKSVVLGVSSLNVLIYVQISSLRDK